MIRSKLGLLRLCAVVLGMMAMFAGSAQGALSWLVLDSNGANPKELKASLVGEKDSADITLLSKLLGKKFTITCGSLEFEGASLETEGKLSEGSKMAYTKCELYGKGTLEEPLGCNVRTAGQPVGTIVSNELKGELVLHTPAGGGSDVLIKVEPKTVGGPFTTLLTEECIFPESNPIRGVLYFKDGEKNAEVHLVKHLIEQGPLTAMWVGSHSVEHLEISIDGSVWLKLGGAHSGLKWAAMDA
jgi:hypothetical protein